MKPYLRNLGLLVSNCSGPQNAALWHGVLDAADALGFKVITYSCGVYDDMENSEAHEAIYQLVSEVHLDGLIVSCTVPIFNSDLGSTRQGYTFLQQLDNLPVVSYGAIADQVPGVLVNNIQGTRAIVEHLVCEHGRRRVAFINGIGNRHDQRLRYQAYCDVLHDYGLPLDPELVIAPDEWTDAATAIRILYEERGVVPDAIVGSNDLTAINMVHALQTYGLHIPADVAVVGFDDIEHTRVISPPLTTVSLRAYHRGQQAVALIEEILTHGSADTVTIPTRLIVRESCGCVTPAVAQAGNADLIGETTNRQALIEAAALTMPTLDNAAAHVEYLLDALEAEKAGKTGQFLRNLEVVLQTAAEVSGDLSALQNAISVLRQTSPDFAIDELLWHQARVMIGEYARRTQAYRDWLIQERRASLTRFGQLLGATQDLSRMLILLTNELTKHNIAYCAIALYTDSTHPEDTARLLFDTSRSPQHIDNSPPVPTLELLQEISAGHANLIVETLHFRDDRLGFVVFGAGPHDGQLYDTLAQQLSSAIKVALLMESNLQIYQQALVDRRRAEEADQLKSRFLLMVSHEIRTPLALLIGLSEMLVRDGLGDRPPIPDDYRADLARIHLGAQQLDGLMRDVMDLAHSQVGQLKIVKKPLELTQVLQAAAAAGEMMTAEKGLAWACDFPDDLPLVSGDRIRLQQVIFNLISNAVKYTTAGEVGLHVTTSPETVTIEVSDTGIGIPPAEHEMIFDEFQQSTNTRGYGGLGLGLAICRRLVEMHGGRIGVCDNTIAGQGSVFYFTLPLLSREAATLAMSRSSASDILLLTSADEASELEQFLAQAGYWVQVVRVTANSFDPNADWLTTLFAQPPAALVLDVAPETPWCWELIAALKQDPITQYMPVLFYALLRDRGALLELDTLTKPIGVEALGQALHRHGLKTENGPTILIADDEAAIREMHATIARHHIPRGRILQAATGQQTMDHLREAQVDLLLLDLMMPEMDGFAVLEAMQADPHLRKTPVIVVTAQVLAEDDMARLNHGVANVLAKGVFSAQETLQQIERSLERYRSSQESTYIVRRALAYIHSHYHLSISRGDMAAFINVSESHLTRCFRQEMGVTPITYLNRYRIVQAQRLLAKEQHSITEIASAVGFSESGYFTRIFRRETGFSPREYQRMHHLSG